MNQKWNISEIKKFRGTWLDDFYPGIKQWKSNGRYLLSNCYVAFGVDRSSNFYNEADAWNFWLQSTREYFISRSVRSVYEQ